MKYLIVIEKTDTGFSAYSPDVPGCLATGETRDVVEHEINAVIGFHLDGMREDGLALPEPSSYVTYFNRDDLAA